MCLATNTGVFEDPSKAQVLESAHEYQANADDSKTVVIKGATKLMLEWDPRPPGGAIHRGGRAL